MQGCKSFNSGPDENQLVENNPYNKIFSETSLYVKPVTARM